MKRLPALILGACVAVASLVLGQRGAQATPFSDVPANHWAYQALQSLAADGLVEGYPDGKFKGDRPLTRYEMAMVVSRVVAKLQENPGYASKADLDKLQKLIDSLKDELDALGVRVTNLEDSLDALDKRTKFAQSLSAHGVILPNANVRSRQTQPHTITNGTGVAQNTFENSGTVGTGAVIAPDPFTLAYLQTDDTNDAPGGYQTGTGTFIRYDSKFALAYKISDNLSISFPIHILNFDYGGTFTQQVHTDVQTAVDVNIKQAGAIQNLHFKYGVLDDLKASRLGLAFTPPTGDQKPPYIEDFQPFTRGVSISGSLFGLTDFQASFSRLDPTYLDTQTFILAPSGYGTNTYLYPIVPPQGGYVQNTVGVTNSTFTAGEGGLGQVFLPRKAQLGSVYISQYNGSTFDSSGRLITQVPGGPTTPPGFGYNDATNAVIFTSPLPAGSTVTISYNSAVATNQTSFQRYMITSRVNQKFKGYSGGEIGVTFLRIYDFDDVNVTDNLTTAEVGGPTGSGTGLGVVSDTVFGVDFQAPIPVDLFGGSTAEGKPIYPTIFGEAANSKFTNDYRNVPGVSDNAGVVGLKLAIGKIVLSGQYQSIGTNFQVGAPFQYFGAAPYTFAQYNQSYVPDFFGFANNLGINKQFDAAVGTTTSLNPNLTFMYPVFNPFRGKAPEYFSSFIPNTRGETASANAPFKIGNTTVAIRANYQHLQEINPNSEGNATFFPVEPTTVAAKLDSYLLGGTFGVPALGQKITVSLSGQYETLKRNDTTGFPYVPINPATGAPDLAANGALAGAVSPVTYFPNYINMKHITYTAALAIPLARDFTWATTGSWQRWGGEYGTTLTQNISENKNYYTTSLTYNIPNTNSSVSFMFRRFEYNDDTMQFSGPPPAAAGINGTSTRNGAYAYGENRADVNFAVRF